MDNDTTPAAWTRTEGAERATDLFRRTWDAAPDGVWASPGRVNIIGEHTDYNGGLCLPIALPHCTYVALRRREDDVVRIVSAFDQSVVDWEGTVEQIVPRALKGWPTYTAGVAWGLADAGLRPTGFDAALVSCVPLGAGLSSSAAVECAMVLALDEVNGFGLGGDDEGRAKLVDIAVHVENDMAGAPTGGMDQAASLRTTEGHALLLDCLDGSTRQVPFDLADAGLELLVIDTRAKHALVDGQYAARRESCEQAATMLGVDTLRQFDDLGWALANLPDDTMVARVRHVVTEIARVQEFVALVDEGRILEVGPLMDASHDSLRDDYEVSCVELDTAVDAARAAGALGARMTGGGFGGCAIALVREADADAVRAAVRQAFAGRGFTEPIVHVVTPAAPGARVS
nr:galactokinase [Acidipropionibacterium timonense]